MVFLISAPVQCEIGGKERKTQRDSPGCCGAGPAGARSLLGWGGRVHSRQLLLPERIFSVLLLISYLHLEF